MSDPFVPPDASQQPWAPQPAPAPAAYPPYPPYPSQPYPPYPPYPPQPWQPVPPGYGGWAPVPRRTNGLAVAALVTGVLAIVPVAIGLGIAALVQTRRRNEAGTGLAVGGLVASGLWTLLFAAIIGVGLAVGLGTSREGDVGELAATKVGTCLNTNPSEVTDCSQPHDREVYLATEVPRTSWPGESEVDSIADDICHGAFEDYVGTSYYDSDYEYAFYAPSQAEWQQGVHTVVCVIAPFMDDRLVGSVRSSGD